MSKGKKGGFDWDPSELVPVGVRSSGLCQNMSAGGKMTLDKTFSSL